MKILPALGASLLLLSAPAHAQTTPELIAQLRTKWTAPSEPFRIIDNVYYVGTAGLSSFLVTSPAGHVLINATLPEATSQIKANIGKLGFKLADIKYLLNTHANFDHSAGLSDLKKDTGAQMVTSAADKALLETAEGAATPVKVDRVVANGDKITVGKLTLVAWMTPGHSPGCTTWTTVAREKKWNHTAVFFCSTSPAINRLTGAAPGMAEDFKKTFATAKGIIADVFLPPHPEMFGMEEKRPMIGKFGVNPFVKAGEFHDYVRKAERALSDAQAKQKAAAGAGK